MRAGWGFTTSVALLLTACPDSDVGFPWCSVEKEPVTLEAAPTWWRDVRPILGARCGGCHVEGGLAPFPLTTLDDARTWRDDIRSAVLSGTMPPWPPAACCNRYRFDRSLSAVEIATIDAWVQSGAPEGDPADAPDAPPPPGGLSRVDLSVEMPVEHTPSPPSGKEHEYRCFLADWPLDRATHVTGVNVIPGTRAVVHHAIVFLAGPGDVDGLRREDGVDEAPGFDCQGGIPQSHVQGSLAGWVPGVQAHDFPDGLGFRVEPGSKLVFGMHYKLAGGATTSDRSRVELKLDDEVRDQALWITMVNPIWYNHQDGMLIPAGDSDVRYLYHADPTPTYAPLSTLRIHNAQLHMHHWGDRGVLGILRQDGRQECLLQVDQWDEDWQGEYWLETPVDLRPGDQLYVECHWDNSEENQPTVDGKRTAPRDLHWGDEEEMCAGYFLVTRR
ncbi:MAG: monooxygenase [Myxococcota bacterium]